jgi:hypothetical protein
MLAFTVVFSVLVFGQTGEEVNWSKEPAYRVYLEYMQAAENGDEISPQLRQEFLRAKQELHERAIQDALSEYTDDNTTKKDPVSLILGDWGRWNFLRFFVLYFLLVIFCLPLFGGRSLIAWGNIFCFPFLLNGLIDKRRKM